MKVSVIITAGGRGKRMGKPKQFLEILKKPMLEWTLKAFESLDIISEIILVVSKENFKKAKKYGHKTTIGGKERTDSVRNGLKLVAKDSDIVVIHDGARPLVTKEIIELAIKTAKRHGACVVGVPVKDTIKKVKEGKSNLVEIEETIDRSKIWQAQTPQVFLKSLIEKGYKKAKGPKTDDSNLVENLGVKVKMIMGSYENIKVTTPEDLAVAESIFRKRR